MVLPATPAGSCHLVLPHGGEESGCHRARIWLTCGYYHHHLFYYRLVILAAYLRLRAHTLRAHQFWFWRTLVLTCVVLFPSCLLFLLPPYPSPPGGSHYTPLFGGAWEMPTYSSPASTLDIPPPRCLAGYPLRVRHRALFVQPRTSEEGCRAAYCQTLPPHILRSVDCSLADFAASVRGILHLPLPGRYGASCRYVFVRSVRHAYYLPDSYRLYPCVPFYLAALPPYPRFPCPHCTDYAAASYTATYRLRSACGSDSAYAYPTDVSSIPTSFLPTKILLPTLVLPLPL